MSRYTTARDGTPIQQSMTRDSGHKNTYNMDRNVLGIILDVQMADTAANIVAQRVADQRSGMHTATVLVVEDGTGSTSIIKNAVITPSDRSSIHDYWENLPKGSTASLSGEELSTSLSKIDPSSLDGEWCVVSFIGKTLTMPYITNWWPHPRNVFDPATSGAGDPKFSGGGSTLSQDRRFFKRTNGVEYVITKRGDLYLSTTYAGSQIVPKGKPTNGRYSRTKTPAGGSVRAWIKPGEVLELAFTPQEDGIGIMERADSHLPQTNPRKAQAYTKYNATEREGTYVRYGEKKVYIEVPESLDVISRETVKYGVREELDITVSSGIDNVTDVDKEIAMLGQASMVKLLQDLAKVITTGNLELSGTLSAKLEAIIGPLDLSSATVATVTAPSVAIGNDVLPKHTVVDSRLTTAWVAAEHTLSLVPPATTPATALTAIEAVRVFIKAIATALPTSQSISTKVN